MSLNITLTAFDSVQVTALKQHCLLGIVETWPKLGAL